MTVRNYRYSDLGVCGRHFPKIKMSMTLQEKLTVFVVNYKIWASKWKSAFWKTYLCHHKLDSVPILKAFSDEMGGDVNEHEFLIVYKDKIDQHLQDLHVFQITNAWYYKIMHSLAPIQSVKHTNTFSYNRVWVHWYILNSPLHLTFKRLPLSSFHVVLKNSHN